MTMKYISFETDNDHKYLLCDRR